MLVSHRKKFIYTKTVKTAGTSVESFFEKYCMPEGEWSLRHLRETYVNETGIIGYRGAEPWGRRWWHHMPASAVKKRVGDEVWQNYFKFCVIRNPFTKLVSAYYFFVENKKPVNWKGKTIKYLKNLRDGQRDPAALVEGETDIERFRSWVKNGGWINDRNKYFIRGQVCVDFFIRQEKLENDLRTVCQKLDVPFNLAELPNLKAGRNSRKFSISEYYDVETIRIVESLYRFEIQNFGYTLPLH